MHCNGSRSRRGADWRAVRGVNRQESRWDPEQRARHRRDRGEPGDAAPTGLDHLAILKDARETEGEPPAGHQHRDPYLLPVDLHIRSAHGTSTHGRPIGGWCQLVVTRFELVIFWLMASTTTMATSYRRFIPPQQPFTTFPFGILADRKSTRLNSS